MNSEKQNITLDYIVKELYKKDEFLKHCTNREIAWLEKDLNIELPAVYKDFLIEMGKGTGNFMIGSDWNYKNLFDIQLWANELLEENEFKTLPENIFVFWMHQGYQFAFFRLGEGDNPPVYYYTEVNNNNGNNDFTISHNSFTLFLYEQLDLRQE